MDRPPPSWALLSCHWGLLCWRCCSTLSARSSSWPWSFVYGTTSRSDVACPPIIFEPWRRSLTLALPDLNAASDHPALSLVSSITHLRLQFFLLRSVSLPSDLFMSFTCTNTLLQRLLVYAFFCSYHIKVAAAAAAPRRITRATILTIAWQLRWSHRHTSCTTLA